MRPDLSRLLGSSRAGGSLDIWGRSPFWSACAPHLRGTRRLDAVMSLHLREAVLPSDSINLIF